LANISQLSDTCLGRYGTIPALAPPRNKIVGASFLIWVQTVAYAENFHGGSSFNGIWWSFVFGVRCLWRHSL